MNIRRRIDLFPFWLILTVTAHCQTCPSGLTPVQDTIHAPAGVSGAPLFGGTITISIATPISVGGATYGQVPATYTIPATTGAFKACLAPNDTATPAGTDYVVRFAYHGAVSAVWTETWYVTTSSAALSVAQIRITPRWLTYVPQPPTSGTFCLASTNGVAAMSWSSCSGGGGGGGSSLSLATLTNSQLTSLGNSQLLTLTN